MGGTKMTKSLREYVNDVMNDNRIFSYEDVLAMDNEEGKYYQKALDYQYGKIGFPNNAELAKSSDVVYVHEYTRQDGTVVRAHYRSKAGHGNPDKPVMQTPNEYKTTLEKEINDYMDRDVEKRYVAGANKTDNGTEYLQELIDILPETEYEETPETEYTPLYPSNGTLTGHIEISHDISNEKPVVNIQPHTKQPAQAKPVSKPYTGREMNMSNVQLPDKKYLGVLDDFSREYSKQNGYENLIQEDTIYKLLTSDRFFMLQKNAAEHPKMVQTARAVLPDAVDTYMGNLTEGKNYEKENENNPKSLSKIAQVTKVSKIQNKEIKDFIYKTYERIRPEDVLVVLNDKSEAAQKLKESKGLQDLINANWYNIKKGNCRNRILGINYGNYSSPAMKYLNPEYYDLLNLHATYGKLTIFDPHIDSNQNLIMYAIDYDDYEKSINKRDILDAINDNAYKLQGDGIVKPYLKIIQIKYTPEEYL